VGIGCVNSGRLRARFPTVNRTKRPGFEAKLTTVRQLLALTCRAVSRRQQVHAFAASICIYGAVGKGRATGCTSPKLTRL
jgi:hypothetical protein